MRNVPGKRTARLLLALGVAAASAAAAADIYKWVGADGGVNYADEPPRGIPSQRLSIEPADSAARTQRPAPVPLEPAADGRADQAAFEPVEPAADGLERQAAAAQERRCLQARMRIAMLQEPMPVYRDDAGRLRAEWRYDDYRGQREYISDRVRAVEIARMGGVVAANCARPDDRTEQVLARKRWMMSEYCAKLGAEQEAAERAAPRRPPEELEARRQMVARYCAG